MSKHKLTRAEQKQVAAVYQKTLLGKRKLIEPPMKTEVVTMYTVEEKRRAAIAIVRSERSVQSGNISRPVGQKTYTTISVSAQRVGRTTCKDSTPKGDGSPPIFSQKRAKQKPSLETLPDREWAALMDEAVKTADTEYTHTFGSDSAFYAYSKRVVRKHKLI